MIDKTLNFLALLVWWAYPIGWLLLGVAVFALGAGLGFLVSGAL